jgi:hypothetical protein
MSAHKQILGRDLISYQNNRKDRTMFTGKV